MYNRFRSFSVVISAFHGHWAAELGQQLLQLWSFEWVISGGVSEASINVLLLLLLKNLEDMKSFLDFWNATKRKYFLSIWVEFQNFKDIWTVCKGVRLWVKSNSYFSGLGGALEGHPLPCPARVAKGQRLPSAWTSAPNAVLPGLFWEHLQNSHWDRKHLDSPFRWE